jgi:hypothetical protein
LFRVTGGTVKTTQFTMGPKHVYDAGRPGWCRPVTLPDGRKFTVGVEASKRVRRMYVRRSDPKKFGWRWEAFVRETETNKCVWAHPVGYPDFGVRTMLLRAGLVSQVVES